ncbi:MAG: ABC transporter permease [Bacteroidales bacterium]|jgi:peptide/nickel transport system permease protein|nr:ABC transporter permease [Bacteroidales bacterium]
MFFEKLKNNKPAIVSVSFLIIVFVVAMTGYLITPDPTPMANRQFLELGAARPGFSVTMLKLADTGFHEKSGFFRKWVYGQRTPYQYIPVKNFFQEDCNIIAEAYTGDESQGQELRIDTKGSSFDKFIIVKQFPLGTDQFGRDLLSRLIIGARVSLAVGLVSVVISLLLGVTIGAAGGYFGGRVDKFVVWLINVLWSVPTLLLVIAITFALGKGFWQIFVAVGFTMWVEVARITRGQILSVREKEYIEAAEALGLSRFRIIIRHILPNIAGPVIVVAASNFATAILVEAGLSFLGIGVQPPMPSWGNMIRENYHFLLLGEYHLALFPGLVLMLTVLSCMILGNGIRDAMDVRSSGTIFS